MTKTWQVALDEARDNLRSAVTDLRGVREDLREAALNAGEAAIF